jgi:hypothetical protein
MQTFYDVTYIARHLGVTKATVVRWANKPTASFPPPVASMRSGDGPRQEQPVWSKEQLSLLRTWLAKRLELSDPLSHWEAVGRGEKHPGGHQNQGALFEHEEISCDLQLFIGP